MSTFFKKTKHPVTGKWENALWIDDYFGRHKYGIRFPFDPKIWNPDKIGLEIEETVNGKKILVVSFEEVLAEASKSALFRREYKKALIRLKKKKK